MLEALVGFLREVILADKTLEESRQMLFRHITAVRLWEVGKMGDGAICVEINVEPQLHPSDVKLDIQGIVFDIHQHFAVGLVGDIDIIVEEGHEGRGMLLVQYEVAFLMFTNEKYLRQAWGLDMLLGVAAFQ